MQPVTQGNTVWLDALSSSVASSLYTTKPTGRKKVSLKGLSFWIILLLQNTCSAFLVTQYVKYS